MQSSKSARLAPSPTRETLDAVGVGSLWPTRFWVLVGEYGSSFGLGMFEFGCKLEGPVKDFGM